MLNTSAPDSTQTTRQLAQSISNGVVRAKKTGRSALISTSYSVSGIDAYDCFAAQNSRETHRWFWAQPDQDLTMVGAGVAVSAIGTGIDRFKQVRTIWRSIVTNAVLESESEQPRAFCGFRFDTEATHSRAWSGYPDASVTIPELLLIQDGPESALIVSSLVDEETDIQTECTRLTESLRCFFEPAESATPDSVHESHLTGVPLSQDHWKTIVEKGAQAVRDNAFTKVVLARRSDLKLTEKPDVSAMLRKLVEQYPACYVFAIGAEASTFMGATPERLISTDGNQIFTAGLAGTASRSDSEQEDTQNAAMLLRSDKDRIEHQIVVDAIHEAIDPLCDNLIMPDEPEILSFRNVHHLHTPVQGTLRTGATLLDLIERLHPTPAVGGYPQADALAFLRDHEQLDRGWYASPIGWIDFEGQGEFAVALRSALLRGHAAALFAGCGVVADSRPELELAESTTKLRPMMDVLTRGKA